MMIILLLFSLSSAFAQMPEWWTAALGVVDKHEFYSEGKVIDKPKDTWQLLFAVTYADRDLKKLKDCVFYRVPGEESGSLKIKTLPSSKDCHKEILTPGDREVSSVTNLKFRTFEKGFFLEFNLPNYKTGDWSVEYLNSFESKRPEPLTSSAEMKAPKIIFLAPAKNLNPGDESPQHSLQACHEIADDCTVLRASTCHQCNEGWYEIPNGCAEGPKYCGKDECGEKDKPACRRGMRFQRVRKKFDCQTDSSFAYCRKGLSVTCEGNRAYCR